MLYLFVVVLVLVVLVMQWGFRYLARIERFRRKRSALQSHPRPLNCFASSSTEHPLCEHSMGGAVRGNNCYRITDSSSVTPYSEEHGFTANDPAFRDASQNPISGITFKAREPPSLAYDAALIESMRVHVLGGWATGRSALRHSRWISTTRRYRWAIWETARRLRSGKVSWVSIATIITYDKGSPNYRGTRKYGVHAGPYLRKQGYGDSDRCVQLAESSSEWLWYGRIFPKDIEKEEVWEADVSGFHESWGYNTDLQECGDSLPEHYFIPKKHRRSYRWIDNLVWNPRDSFYEASEKISDRLDQIQSSRGQ